MYFARNRKCAAELRAQERKKPSRIISLLLVISMLCGNFVGMSTGAAEMVAYCGMEEHTHSEACYCAVQAEGEAAAETLAAAVPTGETAAETTEETTAPTEGAALSVSGGSDAQALDGAYVEKEQCCGKEEHKHSLACYSNPEADLETAAIWEATLPEKLSGDWGKDLAEVAKSQLGYAESAANYLVGADGETLMGYSRYGAWYSDYTQDAAQAYADWNVPFLFFCLYYAGVEDFPIEENCADWTASLAAAELWRDVAGEYIPEAGDLVFLDTDEDGAADRAAVVTEWDEAKVTAVESDSEGAVKSVTYDLTEDTQVLGYGDTNEAQAQIEVSGGEDAPQLLATVAGKNYLYLDLSGVSSWLNDNAVFRIYYKNQNATPVWCNDIMEVDDRYSNTYRIAVPDDMQTTGDDTMLIFVRMNPSGGADWNSKWNQTVDIKISENYNCYKLTSQPDNQKASGDWTELYPDPDDSGGGDDDDDGGGGGGGNTGDVTTTLPAGPVSGYKRVYFDARLASLSYNGDSKSGNPYPSADGGKIYCYVNGSTSNKVEMKKINYQNAEGKIFRDVYYADISANARSVRFSNYELGGISRTGDCTAVLILPTDNQSLCFYADPSDDSIYRSYDGNVRGGDWGKPFQLLNPGTVVDIPSETEENTPNTLYVDATFYDYYTDYELGGNNRDEYDTGASKISHRIYQPFRHFNMALSSYYSNVNASNPIYWGNFQNYSGSHFNDIAATMNLYGYSGSEKKFFAQNNSMWGYNGGELTNDNKDGAQATMGLVSSSLSDAGDLMINTSGGSAVAPYVNKAFLEGNNSKNTVLGKVYENVDFPFTKQELSSSSKPNVSGTVGYWVFDSRNTTLRMKQDSSKGYWLDSTGVSDVYGSTPDKNSTSDKNFFPFNSSNQSATSQRLNYGFATKLEIKFRLTENGTVKTTTQNDVPIEFNFSGDDDVWVFIDGELALDIGGGHGRVSGYLNFADKTYYVSRVKGASGGVEYGKTGSFTIKGANTDEHTLTMFYMERGLWESNMMITFNFPDENQLEVEKEVDMGNVNDIFKDSFKNQKLFTFNIKNLATHFADVNAKGATYNAIPWDVAGSTLTKDPSNTFSRDTYHDRSNALRWFAQYDDGSSQYRHKRYGVLSLPDTIDITNMAKLSFDVFVEGVSSFSLSNMYLQILDADVAISDLVDSALTAGNNNAMGCISSSLSGKTYGTPSTQGGTWVTITLDLSKLDKGDGFDKTRVKHLRFGYNYPNNIYLSNITFLPAAQQKNPTGFITQQYDVPSYYSATSGKLEPAAGAVYTSSVNTNARASYVVDGNGNFALQHGETVNFHDQFRRGSYIYLEEVLNAQERVLYSTKWTMYENDVAVSSKEDGNTINIVSNNGMIDVGTKFVSDGRTELVTNGTTAGHAEKNAYDEADRPANSFVFRSYANPDSTATTTKLKVKFTNTVNVGSLTITKKKVEGTTNLSGSFGFRVRFYNVGGIGLESEDIVLTFSLDQDESKTITGIPLNTQYSIYEIKPTESSHITLDHVTRADSTTSNPAGYVDTTYTTVSGSSSYTSKAYRVDGTISASDEYNVTFYNIYKPVVSLAVTNLWKDGQNNDIANPPASITVQLQRSKNGTTWYSVTDRNIEPGYVGWKNLVYTFEDLDKYVDYPNDQTVWQYRVLEKNGANVVAHNTSITIDGVEFVVTYSSENGAAAQDQNGNWSQTITNTQDSSISLELTKKWTYVNGQPLDPSKIPTSIMVQLQRRAKETTDQTLKSWKAVRVNGGDYVTISTNNSATWTYKFDNLEKTGSDSNGNKVDWEYRVVEWKIVDGKGIAVPNDNRVGDFKVTYHAVDGNGYVSAAPFKSGSDDTLEQTITNVYSPKTEFTVTKTWVADSQGTTEYQGTLPDKIKVQLQRKLKGGTGDYQSISGKTAELTKSENWTYTFTDLDAVNSAGVEYEYCVRELDASDNVVLNPNTVTYGDTTYLVTYPNLNKDDDGNWSQMIQNKVLYSVTLDILKKSTDKDKPLQGVVFELEMWDREYKQKDTSFGTMSATTDANGKAAFPDLDYGYYLLTEIKTAQGYNLLASPIKIEIQPTWDGYYSIKVNGVEQDIDPVDSVYTYSTTIYNKPKLDMPATGGVGGFEFWILGGLLIMAVPLLMYTFIWYRKGGKYLQR